MKTFRSLALAAVAATLTFAALPANAVPVFSATERADGLRQGLGMGLATPADANGYPGPRHVLDSREALHLTPAQVQQITTLFEQMQAEAIPAATRLLADEAALGQLFAQGRADLASVTEASNRAMASQAAVQIIHLKYHVAARQLLTAEQVQIYQSLRERRSQMQSPQDATQQSAPAPQQHHDMPGMNH